MNYHEQHIASGDSQDRAAARRREAMLAEMDRDHKAASQQAQIDKLNARLVEYCKSWQEQQSLMQVALQESHDANVELHSIIQQQAAELSKTRGERDELLDRVLMLQDNVSALEHEKATGGARA